MHRTASVDGACVHVEIDDHPHGPVAILTGDLDRTDVRLVEAVAAEVGDAWVVADHPAGTTYPLPDAVADLVGRTRHRELLQLRRPLPVPADDPVRATAPVIELRAFDPDRDVDAWVRANNLAFAHHPDQGQETAASLRATLAQPWVDLDGFLVVDHVGANTGAHPGELAGSCWTRRHPATATDPALGEIYVIGVHPAHHGRGVGAALALAGLDHLATDGTTTAMLYVEADNAAARRLYDRLGFATHLVRRIRW